MVSVMHAVANKKKQRTETSLDAVLVTKEQLPKEEKR